MPEWHLGSGVSGLSVAFTKEDSAETAAETVLPDRVISPHLNLVTQAGLKALEQQLQLAREVLEVANAIEDINERRRLSANPLRDMRYFAERVRTAQLMPDPQADGVVAFGSLVTFSRDDGRTQQFRIVGEDEADPAAGTMSYVSPVAKVLMGKTAGDLVNLAGKEIEIIEVA